MVSEYIMRHKIAHPVVPHITCADGFSMSVQAGRIHYCSPRSDIGPWLRVEVGFPSEEEPDLLPYAEDPHNPTETVYGYVPTEVVDRIIEKHGGCCDM